MAPYLSTTPRTSRIRIDDGRDNRYEVEVTASDGTGDSTPKTINIAVTDVNEPPRFSESVSTTRRVTENSPEYTPVGGLFYADDPESDPLVYELSGTGYENFAVDTNGQDNREPPMLPWTSSCSPHSS